MQATAPAPAPPLQQRSRARPVYHRPAAAILFVLLAAWLLSPALTATHAEAFSARLQTMAMLDLRGQFAMDDVAYPLDIEYFYTTRGGTVHALEWIMRLTHSTGDINFHILILLSFALFVVCSVRFVRTWSDEPIWAALVVLILTPGLVEISFYFADNLPSAAMVTLALALIGRRSAWWAWFAAGLALACGTLCRIDALVAAPSIALLALLQNDTEPGLKWLRILRDWVAGLAGAALVFLLSWRSTGVSLFQALHVGRLYGSIHNSWGDRIAVVRVVVLFFGPTVLLIALGVYRKWRAHSLAWRLALVVWPFLFYAVFITRTVELRDYLLLGAPFVLLHGTAGLTYFLRILETGPQRHRRYAQAAIAIYSLTLFVPPMLILHDGPRLVLGRIYSPPMWRRWQRTTDDAIQQVHDIATSTRPGERVMVLSTLFQSDRYIHLALLQDGFALMPVPSDPRCTNVETYQKDGRTILHVRTENPYILLSAPPLRMPMEYVRAYQVASGFECVGSRFDRALMVTYGRMWQGYLFYTPEFQRPAGPVEIEFPTPGTPHIGQEKFIGAQRVIALGSDDVAHILVHAHTVMSSYEAGNDGSWHPPQNHQQFQAQAQPLVWKSIPRASAAQPSVQPGR